MVDENDPNDIGYGKPPKNTQFKKGQSGNPKGRPKGQPNSSTELLRILREKVVITENGKRKQVTKLTAAYKQLVNKAASGDLRALHLLTAVMRFAEERSAEADVNPVEMTEVDTKVLRNVLRRFGTEFQGDDDAKCDPE